MKKIKVISFIVIAMMIFNIVAISCISNAVEDTEKIIKVSAHDASKLLTIYAHSAARLDDVNELIEKYCVDIDKVKKQEEEILLFDGAGVEETYDFSQWADDNIEIGDASNFLAYHAIFFAKNEELNKSKIYTASKKFIESKEGTVSDFSVQMIISGNNGEKIISTISDSKVDTFGNQYDDEDVRNIEKTIITDLGGIYNPTEEQKADLIAYFYDSLDQLAKSLNYVFNVNGKKYYLALGYNANVQENKKENGIYKVNVYLITDKTTNNKADKFDTELSYEAYIGNKNVGGTNESGTFKPNYDTSDIKKDADVTATITSKTDEEILAVNGVELKNDGSTNEKGWFYPDLDNKKIIAKQYKFDTYDNSTDNGKVTENVTLTGSKSGKDEQTVSIKWPFRIIDVTYNTQTPTKDTNEVTVTIETNLPMDPNKVPDGWTIVPNTDNHKITRTFKKGEDINTDVTVYQNGTGDSDKTNVKIDWPSDDTVAPTKHPNTGETFTMLVVIGISIFSAVIAKKKIKFKK